MSTTTITGTINGVNNTALANKWITFRLVQLGTDSGATATVAQSVDSVQTDANGDFSIDVWNNGDSGKPSILEITVEGSKAENVIIPAGTASIELWDLIENYQADGSTSEQVPVVSDLFLRKSTNLSDLSDAPTARTNLDVPSNTEAVLVANNLSELTPTAPTARTNLGVAIGTDVQAHSAVLDATTASFTAADESKLDGIEAGATVDQTPAEIKTAYESNADTNVFDDADVTKLAGIEALADVTDATNIAASGGYVAGGTDVALTDGGTGASDAPTARTNLGFQANATEAVTPVTVASYTVLSTDRVLTVDDTTIGSAVTIILPSAATLGSGWTLDIKKTGSTYSVTIDPDLAETIDGDSSLIITEKNQSVKLISNGSNWEVLFPHRITGWAIYDDQASHTSAITVNNTKHLITIDGLGTTTNTTYLPAAITELWNTTDDKIVPAKLGDAYDIRLDFKAQPTNQADYANLILDVGTTGSPIPIVNRSIAFLKTGISSFSVGFPIGTLSDFLTNGGKFYFDTSVSGDSVDISDVVLFIKRDYSTL